MKIREDLVFNKHTGIITGFVDYGQQSLDQHFSALTEECLNTLTSRKRTVASNYDGKGNLFQTGFSIRTVCNY